MKRRKDIRVRKGNVDSRDGGELVRHRGDNAFQNGIAVLSLVAGRKIGGVEGIGHSSL